MRNLLWIVIGVLSTVWSATAAAQRQRSATEWDGESTYHFTPRGTYQHHKRSVGRIVEEKPIAGSWGCVSGPIDAAVRFDNRKQYLFFGSQYARYDMDRNACDPGYPKPIAGGWPGLPWTADIDAAVAYNGKAYFFKGAEYVRYDIGSDRADPGYPKSIAAGWPGVPFQSGIDAAVNTSDGRVLLFKGDLAIAYNIAAERAEGAPFAAARYFGTAPSAPIAATPLAPAAGPIGQCTSRAGCPCQRDNMEDYSKPIFKGSPLPVKAPFTLRNWHYLRDQCDPAKRPGVKGGIGYPGDGRHKPGTPFGKMRDVVAFVVHETGAPSGFTNDGGNLPTFFIDHDAVVYQLRDLSTWENGAGSTYVDQRSLSVEIANGTFVPSGKSGTFTNAYYPDKGQGCPAGSECVDMRGINLPVPTPLPVPLPSGVSANLPSGLVPSILLQLPSEQQLETLYQLAKFVIEDLQPHLGHQIDWDFPAATVNVGSRFAPENYFILTGGGSNFFADALISCNSKSHLQRMFLDCGHNQDNPGGILSHCTVNGAQKSTDGLAPHLFLYLARKKSAIYNTPAKRREALKCMLRQLVRDPLRDRRLQRFFDPDTLSTALCRSPCWVIPWAVQLDSPTCLPLP